MFYSGSFGSRQLEAYGHTTVHTEAAPRVHEHVCVNEAERCRFAADLIQLLWW